MLSAVGFAQDNNVQQGQKTGASTVGNFNFVVKGVAVQDGHTYLNVQSSADIDKDGVPDGGIVRLQCNAGQLRAAHYHAGRTRVTSSGQTVTDGQGGKRTHHPVTLIKEWSPATPQLFQVKVTSIALPKITPKIAKESHGRLAALGWNPITLAETATICVGLEDVRLESSSKG